MIRILTITRQCVAVLALVSWHLFILGFVGMMMQSSAANGLLFPILFFLVQLHLLYALLTRTRRQAVWNRMARDFPSGTAAVPLLKRNFSGIGKQNRKQLLTELQECRRTGMRTVCISDVELDRRLISAIRELSDLAANARADNHAAVEARAFLAMIPSDLMTDYFKIPKVAFEEYWLNQWKA